MAQRIFLLNPWGVDYMDRVSEDIVAPFLRGDTDVHAANLGESAPPLPWPDASSAQLAVDVARKAEADGFDAIVIACCADPFLADVRAAVSVPVVGLTETACISARSRGKLTIVARKLSDDYLPLIPTQGNWDFWLGKAAEYGLTRDQFTLRRVDIPGHPDPETLNRLTREDPLGLRDSTIEAMGSALHNSGLDEAKAAVDEDGATSVFFACAFWSQPIANLGADAAGVGAAIINPLVSGVTFAEQLLISAA